MARQAVAAGSVGPVYINETSTKATIAAVVFVNETAAAAAAAAAVSVPPKRQFTQVIWFDPYGY